MVTTPLTCLNYIDGEWLAAQSKAITDSRNPADWREVIAAFPRSAAADVDSPVMAASQAYTQWAAYPNTSAGRIYLPRR
jgi:aldehyde dehydrogenase (NAD+)